MQAGEAGDWPMFMHDTSHTGVTDVIVALLNLLWKYATGGTIFESSPSASGGIVYLASGDRNVYAFSPCCNEMISVLRKGDLNDIQ